ncbi:ABC transporter substrate-binding protein [Deinococcus lacus]|uniref:ABC transporter substrate-binding protein n=1 Tax=Deinococcus lacus TaxID=392561 RepID=A0ABW1Y8Y9_9DEIO
MSKVVPFPDWPLLRLLAHLGGQCDVACPLSDLTALWSCSPMTAKRHLARLQEQGALTYWPGQGRGNVSRVQMHVRAEDTVAWAVSELVSRRKVNELVRLSRLPFPKSWTFTPEVQALFGLTSTEAGLDRLRTVVFRPLARIHPVWTTNALEAHLLRQVYSGLTTYDPVSRELQPHLAHHWSVSGDGCQWTFHLRKEVAFHDGSPLTSGDVLATMQALQSEAEWFLPHLRDIQASTPTK